MPTRTIKQCKSYGKQWGIIFNNNNNDNLTLFLTLGIFTLEGIKINNNNNNTSCKS